MKSGDLLGGKYRLDQEIGRGAMGAVWSAYDHEANRKVALKVILPQAKEQLTNDLRQRLLREARACRKLSHRNIVQIFDVGETPGGEPFIILELLHGQTLYDRLKEKRRIEPVMAARIAGEVASGLAVAHASHVIHRDLKPANIFLHRDEGAVDDAFVSKVLDFGVCKNLDSSESVATQTGMAVGSPAYMSPEQVGLRKDIDGRTDIWSLGIVLFEMLTGARPFTGSMQDVVRNILLTPVPPPSSKVRDVPPELDAIVARCTAGKRDDRYSNAEELSNALFVIARTTRPMTRKATFTGVGGPPSALPSSSQERPAIVPPLVAPSRNVEPLGTPRVASAPTSQAEEDDELVATLPLQSNMLMGMRRGALQAARPEVAQQAARREVAPTNTQMIDPDAPHASPAPSWNRNEMQQALHAHRQSSAEVGVPEYGASGNTQMLTDSQIDPVPSFDPVGTTSGAGALSSRTSGYPTPPPPLMPMALPASLSTATDPAMRAAKRKQKKVLYAVMGGGIAAAIGVMTLLVISVQKMTTEDPSSGTSEAKAVGSSVLASATAPEALAPTATSAPQIVTAAQAATAAPTETAAPSVTAAAPPSPSLSVTAQVLPPKPPPQGPSAKPTSQGPPLTPTIFEAPLKPPTSPPPKPTATGPKGTSSSSGGKKCVGEGLARICK